ncbi:MAG TPA: hypothetical protein VNG51_10755 [Ktedonobacteraceae bacterium]|nr:hypothetical protein [Ktedonobacteraceae bacterium]
MDGWDSPTVYLSVEPEDRNFDEQSPARVVWISIQPENFNTFQESATWWIPAIAYKICNAYLPPDAIFQNKIVYNDIGAIAGYAKEYYSRLLADTLPASDFTDNNDHIERHGLFFLYFDYGGDGQHLIDCYLGTHEKDVITS